MEYILLIIAMLASFHAYTYAKWLKQEGNRIGTLGIYFFILIGVGLVAYDVFKTVAN